MPTADQILAGLGEIANGWRTLAVAWHVYVAVLLSGLILGVRLSKRSGGILLALPLLSVSALAWQSGNPFNGALFAMAGIVLIAIAARLPQTEIQLAPTWLIASGTLLVAFGWVYPHFLDTPSYWPYLYSAPTGLIPCPTLSVVLGFTLATRGLDSRPWALVLGALSFFYGIFGALYLGVTIDWLLFAGALVLIGVVFIAQRHRRGAV